MADKPHLIVEAGPDRGLEIRVPPAGMRLGRARENDVMLADPLLSRHHCRLSLRDDGALWVTDLDSANQTLVNGTPVTEARLHPGDRVLIGDTLLVATPAAGTPAAVTATLPAATLPTVKPLPPVAGAPGEPTQTPLVDLGFEDTAQPATRQASLRPLLWAAGAAALLLLGAALIMRLPPSDQTPRPPPTHDDAGLLPLELQYEKVEADRQSIFRYEMSLTPDLLLTIRIDDLAENRHVRREAMVATNLVRELARDINESGFFALADSYEGIARTGGLTSWDLTVVLGKRAKRCLVSNRLEPEAFQTVRERIETFGKNELGIWAIQYSRDKLVTLAEESLTRARNQYDERGIAYGNLAEAIRRFREAEFYLETVEPKPDFYGAIVSGMEQAREELDRRYEEQRFLADRALNLKEWSTAARELRILREMIPDRGDPRHVEATRKLLDVENRLKTREKP